MRAQREGMCTVSDHVLAGQAIVVVPTYNERDNLSAVVQRIWACAPAVDILIVDDNSPDGTGALANRLAEQHPGRLRVLHRRQKQGLGRAYLHAFRTLLDSRYEFVLQMDADLSHDPVFIPELLAACAQADLVVGSRYLTGVNVVNWDFKRLLLSKFATTYVNLVTRLHLSDATGGFKCWRRTALERLDFDQVFASGYLFQIEMNLQSKRAGFRIVESPIIFYERRLGQSKIDLRIITEAMLGTIRLAFRRSSPVLPTIPAAPVRSVSDSVR